MALISAAQASTEQHRESYYSECYWWDAANDKPSNFGGVELGKKIVRDFYYENCGQRPLTITEWEFPPGFYALFEDGAVSSRIYKIRLGPGESLKQPILFKPMEVGTYSGEMVIHRAELPMYPLRISLRGSGIDQGSQVDQGSQGLRIIPFGPQAYGDPPLKIAWESKSRLRPTFSSSNTRVATVRGDLLTIVGTGKTTISARVEGTPKWPADTDTAELTVAKARQTIRFKTAARHPYRGAGSTIRLDARSSSGLRVEFSSSNNEVLSVEGRTAIMWGEGEAEITAKQLGDKNYHPAKLTRTFSIY